MGLRWATQLHFLPTIPRLFFFLTYTVGGWMLMLTVNQSRRRRLTENGSEKGEKTGPFERGRVFQHVGLIAAYAALLICLDGCAAVACS